MKNLTLRQKLIFFAATSIVILIFIGIFSFYAVKRVQKINNVVSEVQKIDYLTLKAKMLENDYFQRDLFNTEYYIKGKGEYEQKIIKTIKDIDSICSKLNNNKFIVIFNLNKNIISLQKNYNNYLKSFIALNKLQLKRGYSDYGIIGSFRDIVHGIEDNYDFSDELELEVGLLEVRRYEKNYFLRRDLKHVREVDTLLDNFNNSISNSVILNDITKNDLLGFMEEYRASFLKVVDIDGKIGYTEKIGIRGKMKSYVDNAKLKAIKW